MLKLCYKDYLASRWLWLFPLVIYFLYSLQSFGQSLIVMIFGASLVLSCLLITVILEDLNKTEALYGSLPLRRSTLVKARYLLAGILVVVGGLVIFSSIIPMNAIMRAQHQKATLMPLLSIEAGAGFLVFVTFAIALFLPFNYRLGLGRGSMAFLASAAGLVLAIVVFGQLAGRLFGSWTPLFTAEFFKDPGKGILEAIGRFRQAIGAPLFIVSILVVLGILVFISMRLSIRFYEKREF